jgi:hypothetical protein
MLGLGLLLLGFVGLSVAINGGFNGLTPLSGARARACRRMQRALGLGHRDRRMLDQLACALGIEDPLPLMLGRGCFEEAVLRLDLPDAQLHVIESLRRKIHV